MKYTFIFFLFLTASLQAQNLKSGGVLKPEQANMDIRHYAIALEVDPIKQSIKGYTEIDLRLSASSTVILLDLWHGLTVEQVWVNGKKVPFAHSENDLLTITGSKPFAAGNAKVEKAHGE